MDRVNYIRRGRPEGRPAVNPVNPIVPKGRRGCCAFKQPFTEDSYKMEKSPLQDRVFMV